MTGIYEQIINQLFRCKLDGCDRKIYHIGTKEIGKEEAINYLSRYLYVIIQELITDLVDTEDGVERSIRLVNAIIKKLGREFQMEHYEDDLIDASHSILTCIIDKTACDYPDIQKYIKQITPITTLTQSSLFTGSNYSVNMMSELKKEILSSNEVRILVSFIRQSGVNLLLPELKRLTETGRKLKIITSTYMAATEYRAIRTLAQLPNTEVKISYNGDVDRLHAKAYIFLRDTKFNATYIGSSNISKAALTDGLEWNIKVTQVELPHIMSMVNNTFETYWENSAFETFCPGRDDEKLKTALGMSENQGGEIDYSVLDLMQAKEYQNDVLDKLEKERKYNNNWNNLVVAATGTGKTVIAAFDYKRFRERNKRANFLFVVHREEIIRQACATFRTVLNDPNFGDMWYGGHEAASYSHLFASKDLLNNRIDQLSLPEDYYDYIVFDEAHHIVADSYQKILRKFKPKILLGLTATPERMDARDITVYFGRRISAEIRLDTALNNRLLSPFHYYGITDTVDLAEVRWERGHYVPAELSKVYTANDQRTGIIFRKIEEYLPNYRDVRALCFCVDREHAKYMNAKFTLAGLRSDYLVTDNAQDRHVKVKSLVQKKINYLFVVDMFNEGVDIPEIDTILFLRPTESLTIFLQQFGRGLRKVKGKTHLTVLDFVGHCRAEFNYADRFRALIGRTSLGIKEEVERDFPHLPLNCQIQLEEKAKAYVLENIKGYINGFRKNRIISTIQHFSKDYSEPLSLSSFLRLTHVPIEKLYNGTTWNELLYLAGVGKSVSGMNVELSRAVNKKWLSTDSHSYFSFIHRLSSCQFRIRESMLTDKEKKMALMLYYDLYDAAGVYDSLQDMFDRLSGDKIFVDEVCEVTAYLMDHCNALEKDDNSSLNNVMPLKLHGVYTKSQIQVAIGTSTIAKKSSNREGCERNVLNGVALEAMFVDIIKDREIGSNTNYNDFAQSSCKFHWETQNKVSPESLTGQKYIRQTQTMLLFVRKQAKAADNPTRTMGYVYLGEVKLESYSGSRPMQIVWLLKDPMPGEVYEYAVKYVV